MRQRIIEDTRRESLLWRDMKWVSQSMEKPDADAIVLVYCPGSCEPVWLGYWDDVAGSWFSEDGMPLDEVTHWMDLPLPPTAREKREART